MVETVSRAVGNAGSDDYLRLPGQVVLQGVLLDILRILGIVSFQIRLTALFDIQSIVAKVGVSAHLSLTLS